MPSTISEPVTARIHYSDVAALRTLAEYNGRTVSAMIAGMVHDGLRRDQVAPQQRPVMAQSA